MDNETTPQAAVETPAPAAPKKSPILTILIAVVVVAALCAALTLTLGRSAPLPSYAPQDADLIVYVNNKKCDAHPIVQEFKKMPMYTQSREEVEKILKRNDSKLTVDDLDQLEGCIFINSKTVSAAPEKSLQAIVRFEKPLMADVLALVAKEAPDFKATKLNGKPALKSKDAVILTLNDKMGQFSGTDAELKSGNSSALVKAVNTDALLSIAYQVVKLPAEALGQIPEEYRKLAEQIGFVAINVLDAGKDLQATLVVTFKDEKSAKDAHEQVAAALAIAKKADSVPPEAREIMEKKVQAKLDGKKVIVSAAYPVDKIIAAMKDAMK